MRPGFQCHNAEGLEELRQAEAHVVSRAERLQPVHFTHVAYPSVVFDGALKRLEMALLTWKGCTGECQLSIHSQRSQPIDRHNCFQMSLLAVYPPNQETPKPVTFLCARTIPVHLRQRRLRIRRKNPPRSRRVPNPPCDLVGVRLNRRPPTGCESQERAATEPSRHQLVDTYSVWSLVGPQKRSVTR